MTKCLQNQEKLSRCWTFGMGWRSLDGEPHERTHREGTQDPRQHTGVKAPDVLIRGNRKKWRGDLVKRRRVGQHVSFIQFFFYSPRHLFLYSED